MGDWGRRAVRLGAFAGSICCGRHLMGNTAERTEGNPEGVQLGILPLSMLHSLPFQTWVKLSGLGKKSSRTHDNIQIVTNLPIWKRCSLITQPNINHLARVPLVVEESIFRPEDVCALPSHDSKVWNLSVCRICFAEQPDEWKAIPVEAAYRRFDRLP